MERFAKQDFAGSIDAFEALLAQRRTPARLCNLAAAELGEFCPTVPCGDCIGAGAHTKPAPEAEAGKNARSN
jgi:hypothetical protein